MNKNLSLTRPALKRLAMALAATGLSGYVAVAHPYATCLTNTAGLVSFRLNESLNASGAITIIGNGGAFTQNLGTNFVRGLVVTNLSSFGLLAGPFQVKVSKTGTGSPSQISDDTVLFNQYESPRSIAVNRRSASPYFGRIYVGNSRVGTTASGRACQDGVYMLNADSSDALAQGNTARTGGLDMVNISSVYEKMPWRMRVGQDDDMVYICNQSNTNTPNLYCVDQNVSSGSGVAVFSPFSTGSPLVGAVAPVGSANNHGSLSEVYVTGSQSTSDLTVYTVDQDYQSNPDSSSLTELNSLWRYDIGGAAFPWNSAPNQKLGTPSVGFAVQTMGLDRGANGYFYLLDNRNAGADNCLQVIDPAGPTVLYSSRTVSIALGLGRDWLSNSVSVAVSPDQKYCAVMRDGGQVVLMNLYSGIPDLTNRVEFVGIGSSARQIIFDAADNLYLISNITERMRVFSLGLNTAATTGSDGTFAFSSPQVSIQATQPYASEDGTTATFTISRTEDTSSALVVPFYITGTAGNGVDYATLANSATIPVGASYVDVTVTPLQDSISEPTETVTLTLSNSVKYALAIATATAYISDTNTPVLSVSSASPSMYERLANDYSKVTFTRSLGNTNVLIALPNPGVFTFGGTAVMDVDYVINSNLFPFNVSVGDRVETLKLISPIDNSLLDGNRTVIIGMASGTDGFGQSWVATTNQVATTIIDDEVPAETALWSDNFDVDSSGNYTLQFASIDGGTDYTALFGVDYSGSGIPSAPHSAGDTHGLQLNVNKDATAGAAGVNFYPTGHTFSGNYALRFDMYLLEGTSYTTEYAIFGINHDGAHVNWFRNSGNGYTNSSYDGIWCVVESDASGTDDYLMCTAPTAPDGAVWGPTYRARLGAGGFAQIFKAPPFTVGGIGGGSPANVSGSATPSWADVELAQVNGVVSLRINKTLIMRYTNTVASTSGNIMLGYDDAYDSKGDSPGVLYDNVRVVSLFPPTILTQPVANVVVPAGAPTNLTVVVSGSTTGFTNYQWQLNGAAIAGATASTLVFNNSQPANDGVYSVVVSDGSYSVTSTPSTVVVLPPGVTLGTGSGLEAGYWTLHTNNAPFTGTPTLIRVDSTENFDWVAGSPDPLISADYFTTRWVGQIQALGTETYTFTTTSDDGVRLWVNGQLVVDSWVLQGVTARSGSIPLTGTAKYDLVMEYFEQTGNAVAKLYWSNATTVGYSPVPQSQLYPSAAVSPAVALTSPANGASYASGSAVPLAANVTTNNNVVRYVAFYNGATLLANVTNAPFQYSWTGAPVGSDNLYATAFYNAGWTVGSGTNAITVVNLVAPTISGISGGVLNYSGGAGSRFVLIKTTDLTQPRPSWARIQTNTTTSGSFPIPLGSESRAFYTIKVE